MKRFLALLVVLSLALAQGGLPKDPRFDQPVTQTGTSVPLITLLEALAKSVGLSPVLRDIPSVQVSADFNRRPFRQVWELLISTYGDGKISYVLLDNNVIVVGPREVVARAAGETAPTTAAPSEPVSREFYEVRSADTAQLVTFLGEQVPGATIRVAPGSNSIVVTGTVKQQAEVAAILQRVDRPRPTAIPVVQRSFSLSHARATELAEVLTKTIAAQTGAGAGAAAAAAAAPAATIVGESRTNTIIVTGSADQIALVERLIPQLDRPIQQVQLQIRVQSVRSEVVRNLGIKWETIAGGNLIGSILSAPAQGLNLIFDATRSLTSLNIRAVLDALEQQSLSRRLSDGNVLVEDNYGAANDDIRTSGARGAEIRTGGKLLIPIRVGDQISVREFEYGLTLRVRPQITNDGSIVLEVFTTTGDDPQAGPADSIRIPQQSTLSRLRIRDGQTVVLGGLIQRVTNSTTSQVPILGDIPLLGELFKTRSNSTQDEELIVVITGNIVKDVAAR